MVFVHVPVYSLVFNGFQCYVTIYGFQCYVTIYPHGVFHFISILIDTQEEIAEVFGTEGKTSDRNATVSF